MLRNDREFCPFPGLPSQDLAAPRACLTSPPFPGGLWKSWQGFILSASWLQSRQSLCQGRLYPKGVVTGRPNGAELSRRLRTRCSPDFTPVLLRALPLTPATWLKMGPDAPRCKMHHLLLLCLFPRWPCTSQEARGAFPQERAPSGAGLGLSLLPAPRLHKGHRDLLRDVRGGHGAQLCQSNPPGHGPGQNAAWMGLN